MNKMKEGKKEGKNKRERMKEMKERKKKRDQILSKITNHESLSNAVF